MLAGLFRDRLEYLSPQFHFHSLDHRRPTNTAVRINATPIARQMLLAAERDGILSHDKIIMEPTSGNTGISLAMLARHMGYRMLAVMPENVSHERRALLELYGAQVELTDGARGSNGSIARAQEMASDPRYVMLYQYGNAANPQAHYETTGPEIVEDLPEVDVFVAGMGTGGTLMGVGRRLSRST